MTKKTTFKPTNKMRDEAIAHLMGKTTSLENMIEGLAKTLDIYIDFSGNKKDFLKKLNEEIEKSNEEHRAEQTDGPDVEEDKGDEGQRTEGVREKV